MSGVHKEPIKLKPNEVKAIKIKFRNNGGIDWLQNFSLYQLGDHKFSALNDGSKAIAVGNCKVKSFKSIDLVLRAPKEGGTHSF
jgi:hypothetical protein